MRSENPIGGLHRMQSLALGKTFDRGNPQTVRLNGKNRAGLDRLAVEQNRTGAAYAMLATDVNPEGLQLMT